MTKTSIQKRWERWVCFVVVGVALAGCATELTESELGEANKSTFGDRAPDSFATLELATKHVCDNHAEHLDKHNAVRSGMISPHRHYNVDLQFASLLPEEEGVKVAWYAFRRVGSDGRCPAPNKLSRWEFSECEKGNLCVLALSEPNYFGARDGTGVLIFEKVVP